MSEPYYQDSLVTIYHGDCLEVMAGLDAVDLVVTSPPYNLGKPTGAYANMRDGYLSHGDNLPDDSYMDWQRECISRMWDLTTPNGAIFYNHKPLLRDGRLMMPTRFLPAKAVLRQVIIWNRVMGMNWSPTHFKPVHEWILLIAHRAFQLESRSSSGPGDVWTIPPEQRDYGHPCPFPVAIPSLAISATTASKILDPFAGVGSTLRAAKDLGRRAVGIEKEERYCEVAAERCRQETLFGEVA